MLPPVAIQVVLKGVVAPPPTGLSRMYHGFCDINNLGKKGKNKLIKALFLRKVRYMGVLIR